MTTEPEDNADNFSKASTAVVEESSSNDSNEQSPKEETRIQEPQEKTVQINKPYLGGYKHKLTGVIYHHASTQTSKPPWKSIKIEPDVQKFCRDAQTVETKNQAQQTPRHVSTQVQVTNIFMQNQNEKELIATDNYVSADMIQADVLAKVLILQKYVRRWLAQREVQKRRKDLQDRLVWEEQQKRLRKKQDLEWLKEVQRRKLSPITEDDFMLLFSDLQDWWKQKVQKILETKEGQERQEALWELVNDEVKKIAEINESKRVTENKKLYDQRMKLLTEVSKPKVWKAYKRKIPVITAKTEKNQNLQSLYNTLSLQNLSIEDRLEALESLVQLLQRHNNNLTNTLKQLIQREIDLLLRGTKPQNLEGLRGRIQDLFWRCLRQPRSNNEMFSLQTEKDGGDCPSILCCSSCKQFFNLPPRSANEAVGKSVMGTCFMKCKKCLYLENEGWMRKDVELHKKILKILIEGEEKKSSSSMLIYILQPSDIKHLVEEIWKRQSCLSGSTNENDLELIRYKTSENWTPWNCLLVTRDEAAIIDKIPNPQNEYDADFKKFVYQRHVAARSYFSTIPRFLPFIEKSVIQSYFNNDEDA